VVITLIGGNHVVVNHLLYLDDLKLYGRNQCEIQSLVNTAKMFSDDICMKFGFNKCASLSIKRGVVQAVVTPNLDGILPLNEGSVYKYLGVLENNVFNITKIKALVQQEFLRRSKVVTNPTECWEQGEGNKHVCSSSSLCCSLVGVVNHSTPPIGC